MPADDVKRAEPQVEGLGTMAAIVVAVLVGCWLLPNIVTLLYTGHAARVSPAEAIASLGRLLGGGLSDPAAAYPPRTRALMPSTAGWWGAMLWFVAVLGALVAAFMRHVEPQIARETLDRRPFDWRGARPRPWARPRDLRIPDPSQRGFSVGRLDGRPLWTEEQAHIAVIAPTRAGKTTRCVIPWLLEHDGPAIVTSTKRDVLDATREQRAARGEVWVFDPFSSDCTSWTPLAGCDSWSYALRQAQWLADASSEGNNEIARFWRGEAAKLLAPLLCAAAVDGRDMQGVLRWVDGQEIEEPSKLLLTARPDAAAQLGSFKRLDDRNRGTTFMSAGAVLAGYRHPEVNANAGTDISVDEFLRSPRHTLYIVAAERHQRLLAPLVVSLISSIVNGAAEGGGSGWGDRRLRILLDEAANIAPLNELPRMLSQAAGHNIRFATIWQSLAQIRERHGVAADTVLANSTARLFMGPISDESTQRFVGQSLEGSRRSGRNLRQASDRPDAHRGLLQLRRGSGLLTLPEQAPAIVYF